MSDRPVCSYEGSKYSTEFWTSDRAYEDAVERVAMTAMLPPTGSTLVEIGAGFGRLADLYQGYDTVVIFDYASTQLEQAVERLGDHGPGGKPEYIFVQADFYKQPFVKGLFDTVTMIRTLHHAMDAPAVLKGMADIIKPEGALVMEFANKQNIKAIGRWVLKKQDWSPFEREPVEFVELNFDFHPKWMWEQFASLGLTREAVRTVSHFRMDVLKKRVPTAWLVAMDSLAQRTGNLWQLSPSVFVRARADADRPTASPDLFFRCPECGASLGAPPQAEFHCECGVTWRKQGHIYNFRDPA